MKKKQAFVLGKYVNNLDDYTHVIGIDEVGWGAIAGPLGVAAAVLPIDFVNPVVKRTKRGVQYGFKDSKRFTTDKSRARGAEFAKENVLEWKILCTLSRDVCFFGPKQSLKYLQQKLVRHMLKKYPNALIVVDGNKTIRGLSDRNQVAIVGADAKIPAVSAASIIAKMERDTYMMKLGELFYPAWEFHKNKGYPTSEHLDKLKVWGPTHVHRTTITQVQDALDKFGWYDNEGVLATAS